MSCVFVEEVRGKYKVNKAKIKKVEDLPDNCEVFLEEGAPKNSILYRLLEKGCKIYLVPGVEVKKFRDELGVEKSDENDPVIIAKLWLSKPKLFRPFTKPEKEEVRFNYLMRKYLRVTKDLARMKNRAKAYEREFGSSEAYKEIIKILEKEKQKVLKEVKPLIAKELEIAKDMKGVDIALMARLLASAHPKNFPTLSRYLLYCGYKEWSKKHTKRYNREAHTVAWLMASNLIMKKDSKFYPLYLKIKEDLRQKYPDYTNGKIHGMAMNRLATFVLKHIYTEYWRLQNGGG